MASDKIIRYDKEFIANFEKLPGMIEAGDHKALHRFLMDHFGFIFKVFQDYAREEAVGGVRDFEDADEETKRELMRPLSLRQYRMEAQLASIRQMSGQVSRGSAGEYQADERAGVARLSWRVSGR